MLRITGPCGVDAFAGGFLVFWLLELWVRVAGGDDDLLEAYMELCALSDAAHKGR